MIQIITYDISKYESYSVDKYKISAFREIQALDDFEICIIDLASKDLWHYNGINPTNINSVNDFLTLKEAIINSKKSKILIIFPQNEKLYYNFYDGQAKYLSSKQIKDNKDNTINLLSKWLYELEYLNISYEKTNTTVNDSIINADFNFLNIDTTGFEPITYSNNSGKITTIKKERVYLTTLDLSNEEKNIINFIDIYLKDKAKKGKAPKWIDNIKFFNDEELDIKKKENISKIKIIENDNEQIDRQLEKNAEIKSILYTNGDELVRVVLDILDEILEYNSSTFVDEGKEDFLIKKEDVTFIGEIKGVSSAAENKYISQLDVHVQSYLDENQKEGIEENVKGLLIINHQRNKPVEERQKVHEHQIKLATRNGSLIIETSSLLKMYEKYKLGNITKEECKNILKTNIGLLEII